MNELEVSAQPKLTEAQRLAKAFGRAEMLPALLDALGEECAFLEQDREALPDAEADDIEAWMAAVNATFDGLVIARGIEDRHDAEVAV
jgi:hypothetical protein